MASRIEDYALIGDCQTAALVGRDGSIDWLCLPRFDSAACFAALLGHARARPLADWPRPARSGTSSRRYRDGTLVLETEFETDGGAVRLIDFMPPRDDAPDAGADRRRACGARSRCGWSWSSGSTTGRSCRGSAARTRHLRPSPAPTRWYCRTDVRARRRGLADGRRVHRRGGRAGPVRADVAPVAPTASPSRRIAEHASARDRSVVARLVGPLHVPRASGARPSCAR